MLKDYLLDWCEDIYTDSCAGECGTVCNNRSDCEHDCDKCLDQVHWFQEGNGRRDYDCPLLLLRYVHRFTDTYSSQIRSAIRHVDLSKYPEYNIFSIGCGGAPDLMAFEEISQEKQINYIGYDRNLLWKKIHDRIEQYVSGTPYLYAKLRQHDIFDVFADRTHQNPNCNIVIIQYLLSHLFNTGQSGQIEDLFDCIIENFLTNRQEDSPFLIVITDIDCWKKGRNTWYILLDKLEEAGHSGTAYAHSAYPTGDLGAERWSGHKASPVYDRIKYKYYQNHSEHDGAQLIIELK